MKVSAAKAIGCLILAGVMLAVSACSPPLQGSPAPTAEPVAEAEPATVNATPETPQPEPLPDLIIESVSYVPVYSLGLDFADLTTLYFTLTIKNIGDAAASGSFYVTYTRDDQDYYSSGVRINDYQEIEPGQTRLMHLTRDIPERLSDADIWTIRFLVNHQQDFRDTSVLNRGLAESKYDNNTFDVSMSVGDLRDPQGAAAQAGQPDLIIDSVRHEFKSDFIVFYLNIKNIGTAPVSGPFYVLNGPDYLSQYISRLRVNRLGTMIAPGETLEVASAKAFPPKDLDTDDWYVELVVNHLYDPDDKSVLIPGIEESNYDNNTLVLKLSLSELTEELRILNEPAPPPRWGPQILSPQGGATTTLKPEFAWWPISGATRYEFVVATDPNLTQIVFSTTTDQSSVSLTKELMPDTIYFWSVRAVSPRESGITISTFTTQKLPD